MPRLIDTQGHAGTRQRWLEESPRAYSGIQQTGVGTIGADRPDQIGLPDLSSAGSFNPTARRLVRAERERRKLLCHSDRGRWWNWTKLRALWNARLQYISRPGLLRFRFCARQDDSDWPPRKRFGRADLQFRAELFNLQHGTTCKHHRMHRVWHDQQDRRNFTANSVFFKAHLLRRVLQRRRGGGRTETCVSGRFRGRELLWRECRRYLAVPS